MELKMLQITKVLCAIALTAWSLNLYAGVLSTSTSPNNTINYSIQGARAASPTDYQTIVFSHQVNNNYLAGDKLTYSLTGATGVTRTSWPASFSFYADPAQGANGAGFAAARLSISSDYNTAVYRITSVSNSGPNVTTQGAKYDLFSLAFAKNSLLQDIELSATSTRSGVSGEYEATPSLTLINVEHELSSFTVSSELDAVIAVTNQNKAFVSGNSDSLSWSSTATNSLTDATGTGNTLIELSGDFTGFANTDFTSLQGGVTSYDDSAKKLSVTYSGLVSSDTISITPPSNASLVSQAFNVVASIVDGGNLEIFASQQPAGLWSPEPLAVSLDINQNGILDIPLLGALSNGKKAVLFYDSLTGVQTGVVYMPGWFTGLQVEGQQDTSGNGYAEIVSLGTTSDGKKAWLAHDADNHTVSASKVFPSWYQPQSLKVIPDVNGDSVEDILVRGSTTDGKSLIMVQNGATGADIKVLVLPNWFVPLKL